jgi:hypothetical protein
MIKLIFKMFFSLIIISFFIWLNFNYNKITIEFAEIVITTSILRLLIVLFIMLIPLLFFRNTYGKIKEYFIKTTYTKNIINNLQFINSSRDKDLLIQILNSGGKSQHLEYFKTLNEYLHNNQYDKLQKYLTKHKLPNNLKHIEEFFQVMLYFQTGDTISATELCKKYINQKNKHNQHFAVELSEYALKESNIKLLEYIIDNNSKIYFDKDNNTKYYCLVQYKIAQEYLANNKQAEALVIINKVAKRYPIFSPIYELQFKILSDQKDQKNINKHIENIWKKQPSYDNIKLYTSYYKPLNKEDIIVYIKTLYKSSSDDNLNFLLAASIAIKFDKLILAQELLEKTNSSYKDFVKIELLQKEGNYQELINMVRHKHFKSSSFWTNYI